MRTTWPSTPKGYVPALQLDSGEVLTEGRPSSSIWPIRVPQKNLAPANGTLARYHLQSWLTFIGTEIHKNYSPFFNPAAPAEMKDIARANLQRRLGYVNEQLAMGLPAWPIQRGGRLFVRGGELVRIHPTRPERLANLTAGMARMAARPAVQAALKAEGLIK